MRVPLVLILAATSLGCVIPATPQPGEDTPGAARKVDRPAPPTDRAGNPLGPGGNIIATGGLNALPALTGMVRLPAGIIAAGGGNIIAAGGGNIISTGGGNHVAAGSTGYRLAALTGQAVQGAEVRLVDEKGQPIPDVPPAITDHEGRFRFEEAPRNRLLFVQVEVVGPSQTSRFEAFSRLTDEPGAVADVTPASTLVTQKARLVAAEQETSMASLDASKAAQVAEATEKALAEGLTIDFSQAALQLTAAFDKLLQLHPDLAERARALDPNIATPFMREKRLLVPAGQIANPGHMAYDAAGNLFIAGLNDHTVWKLPAGSETLVKLASSAEAPALKFPRGIAVDAAGNVYASRVIGLHYSDPGSGDKDHPGEQVFRISPDGQTVAPLAYTFRGPAGMTLDAAKEILYVAQSADFRSQIIAYDLKSDTGKVFFEHPKQISGISQDSKGLIYFSDTDGGVFTLDAGGISEVFNRRDTSRDQGFYEDLAFDAADNLYVPNNWGKTIFKFTPRGKKLETRFTFGSPTGIARDAHGNLAVADYANGEIWLITP